jgi:hypothetical protein
MPPAFPPRTPELVAGLEGITKTCLYGLMLTSQCSCASPVLFQRIADTVDRLYALVTHADTVPIDPAEAN